MTQFSSEANKLDLYSLAREILGLDETDTTTLTLAQFARASNIGLDKMLSVVLRSDGRFKFDGTDQTDQPIGKFDLVSGQYEYGFASTHLKILGISIKDSAGNMQPLANKGHITDLPQDMKNYRKTNGTPQEFCFGGNSFYLFPQSNETTTGKTGGRVYFQRHVTYFTATATTTTPPFAPQFHYLIAYYGVIPYCLRNELWGKLKVIQDEILKGEATMAEFYATRDANDKPALRFRKTNYGHNRGGGYAPTVANSN